MGAYVKRVKTLYGDIMTVGSPLDYIVVPTNIGWTRDGYTPMGAGVARLASYDDPGLPLWYGAQCMKHKDKTPVMSRGRFILFPTKPLFEPEPWVSWKQQSRLDLIEKGMRQLKKWHREDPRSKILIPLLGCGNGKLKEKDVLPVLQRFWMNRYRLVRRK